MTSRVVRWTIDVGDVDVMAEFWSQVLGYRVDKGDDGSATLYPVSPAPESPPVWLQPTAGAKPAENRVHPDLSVVADDPDAEIDRLLALGAQPADLGQIRREGFTVLADPEGNEFRVLYGPPSRPI